jgi:RarD protein
MKNKLSMIISMVIFGTIGIFVELMGLPSGFVASFRGIVGAILIVAVMLIRGNKPNFKALKKKLWLLLLSGGFIGLNWILLFESYRHTGIPVATVCYYTAPLIVTGLSPVVLKEKLSVKQIVCIFIALAGIIAVSGVLKGGSTKLLGVCLGLGAAVLYACVVLMNKFMGEVPAYEKTAVQLGSAGLVALPYALLTSANITFNVKSVVLLLVVGIVHTGIAYMLYFESIKRLKAQTVAILSYIDPVTAVVLSAVLLHEPITLPIIIGALLILGSSFLSEIKFVTKLK